MTTLSKLGGHEELADLSDLGQRGGLANAEPVVMSRTPRQALRLAKGDVEFAGHVLCQHSNGACGWCRFAVAREAQA